MGRQLSGIRSKTTYLFEVGRFSSGNAGLLCGMGRVEFLMAAGRAGVPAVDMDAEELKVEFASDV